MTPDDFREIVLALDGAAAGSLMNHPDFRANGRIFASLLSEDRFGLVKLTPEVQAEFLREHPKTFEPSAGAWG
ncbi:MAG: MmcQ/YjbR family DNA-binding protein, partial [Vicinamibacteria bacterium]